MRLMTLDSQVAPRMSAKVDSILGLAAARPGLAEDSSMCRRQMPMAPPACRCLSVFFGNGSFSESRLGMPGHSNNSSADSN